MRTTNEHSRRFCPGLHEWFLLLALTVMWGSAFMLTKLAVSELPTSIVVTGRLLVAAAVLLILVILLKRRHPEGSRVWVFYVLIATFGNAIPFYLISWGQKFIDSGLAGILMAIVPLIVLVLSHFLIPGERLTTWKISGFVLGFIGIVVLMGTDSLSTLHRDDGQALPMLAVLGGAACYAVAAILARLRPNGDAVSSAAWTTVLAAAFTLPLLAGDISPADVVYAGAAQWIAILGLGVFSTAVATIVYFRLISRAGPAFVSQLNYLIPVWAVALGIVFLNETPQTSHLYALVLVLAGIMISQLERIKSKAQRVQARRAFS